MPEWGQNPNLPRRSIAVRFTLNKQTPTGGAQYDAMCHKPTCAVQQIRPLLDHLVGASKHGGRYIKADCLRGLKVERQHVLGGLLHRKIAGLFAPKNTVNVLGRLPEAFFEIKSVGDEPTGRDGAGAAEDRGQAMLQFHCNEEIFICPGNDVRQDNHSSILMRREGRYGALDFSSIVDASGGDLDAQVRRGILDRVRESLMDGGLGMKDCQYAGKVGRGLLQHLKPLAAHWAVVTGEAGHVAARTGQACYEAVAD